jgi:TPR repeat protein
VAKPESDLFDVDAREDPLLAEYKHARDLILGGDWQRGLPELEELANRGSIMSILLIADAMRAGWMYSKDLPRAEAWYRVAVKSGSARGLFGLGLTHLLMGRYSEAIQELEEASDARNFPPALNTLAGIYFRGDGVKVDRRRALNLWRRAASLGHLPAKQNLLIQCSCGQFGPWWFVWSIINLLPFIIEMSISRTSNPYTDRLR